jgi:ABC-type transport system substrate-binding protein
VRRPGRTLACLALLTALSGCGKSSSTPKVTVQWVVGESNPGFDPQGPPDPVRWALERLLSRGLMAEDSTGHVMPAAAESVHVSANGLVYTFTLRSGLTYADGHPCAAADFKHALESGVNRQDHTTYAWLLSAVTGVEQARAGRPLPTLGISAPDPHQLVLHLTRPDPRLLEKLAYPGVSVPWRPEGPGWGQGIGDYHIAQEVVGRMTLVRRRPLAGAPDTINVRFFPSASRIRSAMRADAADLIWPLPGDLLDQSLPPGYHSHARAAHPARHLVLLQQADLPPMTQAPARQAFAHGMNTSDVMAALSPYGGNPVDWLEGAGPYDAASPDPEEVRNWLDRGHLGRSLHATMVYALEGPASRVARGMQAEWARDGLDVELHALRRKDAEREWLRSGTSQLRLVEAQAPLDGPGPALACWIQPLRGPAVGGTRTGWRTREFDRWIRGEPMTPADVASAAQRIADERIVIPLAELPWVWVTRDGARVEFHPRFGPEIGTLQPVPAMIR